MMKEYFVTFADYNRWANRRVYDAAAKLRESDYRADRGAFFGSLHATFNHILVADRIWLWRITGEGEAPDNLDAILYDDRDTLKAARDNEDARFVALIARLDDEGIAAPLTFRSMKGIPTMQPLGIVLAHVFNHQTHHRGQVHALLTGLGVEGPVLDLVAYVRERG